MIMNQNTTDPRYIEDLIKEDYQNWDNTKPIIISAPTGSGKTTFIMNHLLPHAIQTGKTIMYLANRTALLDQIRHEIKKRKTFTKDYLNGSESEPKYFNTEFFAFLESNKNVKIPHHISTALYHHLAAANVAADLQSKCVHPTRIFREYHKNYRETFHYDETYAAKLRKFKESIELARSGKEPPHQSSEAKKSPSEPKRLKVMVGGKLLTPTEFKAEERKANRVGFVHNLCRANYIILDESHFFLADAEFNNDIPAIVDNLKMVRKYNPEAIWVFMTATVPYLDIFLNHFWYENSKADIYPACLRNSENCKSIRMQSSISSLMLNKEANTDLINAYEAKRKEYYHIANFPCFTEPDFSNHLHLQEAYLKNFRVHFNNKFKGYEELHHEISANALTYSIPPDYSYVEPVYYHNIQNIKDAVRYSDPTEKWIIFVSDDTVADDFTGTFTNLNISCVYVNAKNKRKRASVNNQEYTSIVKDEKFSSRVLITTSALDNGININDNAVQNVVILNLNSTTFLQMLGRKRIYSQTPRIRLYLRYIPWNQLESHYTRTLLMPLERLQTFLKLYYQIDPPEIPASSASIPPGNMTYAMFVERIDRHAILSKLHQSLPSDPFIPEPISYMLLKMSYDFYQAASFFESEHNRRLSSMQLYAFREFYRVLPDENSEFSKYKSYNAVVPHWYNEYENELKRRSYLALKMQLSWIGKSFETPDDPLHPCHEANWFGVKSGIQDKVKKMICDTLHTGRMPEPEKKLLISWLQIYACTKPFNTAKLNANCRVDTVNKHLQDLQVPYEIEMKHEIIAGKKTSFWIVNPKPAG